MNSLRGGEVYMICNGSSGGSSADKSTSSGGESSNSPRRTLLDRFKSSN
jgi:hypothetical protein